MKFPEEEGIRANEKVVTTRDRRNRDVDSPRRSRDEFPRLCSVRMSVRIQTEDENSEEEKNNPKGEIMETQTLLDRAAVSTPVEQCESQPRSADRTPTFIRYSRRRFRGLSRSRIRLRGERVEHEHSK